MGNSHKFIGRSLAVATTAIAIAGLVTIPANADTFTIEITACSTGSSTFVCGARSTGGTAPVTRLWAVVSGAGGLTDPTANAGRGTCTAGSSITIQVTDTDATGLKATTTHGFVCSGGSPV
jgi:hypothetical protein